MESNQSNDKEERERRQKLVRSDTTTSLVCSAQQRGQFRREVTKSQKIDRGREGGREKERQKEGKTDLAKE